MSLSSDGDVALNYKRVISFFMAAFMALGQLSAYSTAQEPVADDSVVYLPIIMYHEVKPYNAGKDVIFPWELENDLKYLSENDYTAITMNDLINYVYDEVQLPKKPIVLSFDDGYLNNYVYVLPLLKKYSMKMVFSIIGKNTDDFTRVPDDSIDYSHVTWEQLNEMLD